MMKFLIWCKDGHIQISINDFGCECDFIKKEITVFGWIKKQPERMMMKFNQAIQIGTQNEYSSYAGYHVICEETTSPFIRPYAKTSLVQREALISSWGPEYKVTLELKPINEQNQYASVIHFYGGGNTNPSCGVRMPEFSKTKNMSKGLTFRTCANNISGGSANRHENNGSLLVRMDWNQIEIGQRNMEGQYQYYIKIGETEVYTRDNNQPISLTNVHAFIGTPFYAQHFSPASLLYTDMELRNIQGKVLT